MGANFCLIAPIGAEIPTKFEICCHTLATVCHNSCHNSNVGLQTTQVQADLLQRCADRVMSRLFNSLLQVADALRPPAGSSPRAASSMKTIASNRRTVSATALSANVRERNRLYLVPFCLANLTFANTGPSLKSKTPYGQLPVLTVTSDGKSVEIADSFAIQRYVAKKAGLFGSNDEEAAQIDGFGESVNDALRELAPAVFSKVRSHSSACVLSIYLLAQDENEKKTKLAAYFKDVFPRWANTFTCAAVVVPAADSNGPLHSEHLKKHNKDGKGWVFGEKVRCCAASVLVSAAVDRS